MARKTAEIVTSVFAAPACCRTWNRGSCAKMLAGLVRGRFQLGAQRGILGGRSGEACYQQRRLSQSQGVLAMVSVTGLLQQRSGVKGVGAGLGNSLKFWSSTNDWRRFLSGLIVGSFGGGVGPTGRAQGPEGSSPDAIESLRSEVGDAEVGPLDESKTGECTNGVVRSERSGIERVTLLSGASCLPHPEKAYRGGEDASFIADNGLAIGVADGVGGWALSGIDAGVFAKQLMANVKDAVVQLAPGPSAPVDALRIAHSKSTVPGSSTACVVCLDSSASVLYAANLGDSGFLVVRDGASIFKSPVQTWSFNCPYQLGPAGNVQSYNSPDDAESFAIQVRVGDVIVAATDGVFDNLFTEDCVKIVNAARNQGLSAAETSEAVAKMAFKVGNDRRAKTPFKLDAQANGISYFGGGKLDDITVVVSYVSGEVDL